MEHGIVITPRILHFTIVDLWPITIIIIMIIRNPIDKSWKLSGQQLPQSR